MGGIKVSVDSISGNGSIASNGGKGGTSISGGGGGGRIAVYYKEGSFPWDNITTYGGSGYNGLNGGEGTVYIKNETTRNSQLILKNNDIIPQYNTLISSDITVTDLSISNSAKADCSGSINGGKYNT